MGLLFRRRRPLMRLAAGAAVGGAAYRAGRRREEQGAVDEQAQPAYAATEAVPVPAAAVPAPADTTAQLERLAQLHQSGALTDDEFSAAKSRLLGV